MIVTLDTNILVYTVDDRAPDRQAAAQEMISALRSIGGPLALQVCGEFYRASTRRLLRAPWEAAQISRNLMIAFPVFPTTMRSMERALAEAATARFSFWDANLLCAAEAAGCTHIISEDMKEGSRIGGIEVVAAFNDGAVSARARKVLGL
ncbi:MAG: PIN domain-containing protein [Bauldia sp.]|nr:PIN domain-containing protein [Bauldia sp.]